MHRSGKRQCQRIESGDQETVHCGKRSIAIPFEMPCHVPLCHLIQHTQCISLGYAGRVVIWRVGRPIHQLRWTFTTVWLLVINIASLLIFLCFLIVMVIGAFVICYVPAVVCVLLTVKLGPSGVPDAFRSAVIVMLGMNSALNPIVYMLRSNEFKRAFRNLFRGASVESSRAAATRIGLTRLDVTTYGVQPDLPSFLGVPVVSVSP